MKRFFVLAACLLTCCSAARAGSGFSDKSKRSDLKYPVINFNAEVDGESVYGFVEALKTAEESGAQRIVVMIHSPGGSVFAGMEMARAIENSPATIVCVVDGMAASMGAYILQSCDERVMTKRSLLMFHQPLVGGAGGHAHELRKTADLLEKLGRALIAHMAARSALTAEELEAKLEDGFQWWMNWDHALVHGFVDRVSDSVWDEQKR